MTNLAFFNAATFNSIESAKNFTERAKNKTNILLGDNGLFLVPATKKEESILIKSGYERMI